MGCGPEVGQGRFDIDDDGDDGEWWLKAPQILGPEVECPRAAWLSEEAEGPPWAALSQA